MIQEVRALMISKRFLFIRLWQKNYHILNLSQANGIMESFKCAAENQKDYLLIFVQCTGQRMRTIKRRCDN